MPSIPEGRVGRFAPPLGGGEGLAWLSLAGFSILWLARLPSFPLALDPYYHLLIARQLVEAGGPFIYETWQYAPVGRPHLYPPVLHLVLAGLLKAGCPPVAALQAVTAALLPALLASIYLVMRRLATPAIGLAALWAAMLPFAWMIQVAGALASGLALIALLWLMVAVKERRVAASAGLLGLIFYTHLGLAWVALASLAWWWYLMRAVPRDRVIPASAGLGMLLAAPWLWHLASHATFLQVMGREENRTLDLLPALYALALYGGWRCWRQGGVARLFLGLWLGFVFMAPAFAFRWLSGEGVLPVILLAGWGLVAMVERLIRGGLPRRAGWALAAGTVVLGPSVVVHDARPRAVWFDTAPFHLLNSPLAAPKATDLGLHTGRTSALANAISAMTRPGEILWSNASYAGGLIAALANRPTSSAMFYEVPPARPFDPVKAAHWIVWFKVTPMPDLPPLQALIRRYQLAPVGEDALAMVLRNPAAGETAQAPRARLPWWVAFMLLWMLLGCVISGFRKDPWPK